MAVMWATDATGAAVLDQLGPLRSREAFLRSLKEGRSEGFEALFALYRAQIYNLAVRMLEDPEDAKDVTQEIFLKAFQQIPRQNGDFELEPWLYRVAANACLDHLRARRRHPTSVLSEEHEQPSARDQFEQAETTRLIEQTLGRLSERHRLALVLKDLHGLSHEEISDIMGISRGAAETLLFRARESFRKAFEATSGGAKRAGGCAYARSLAMALVGREVSPLRKRELVEHAKVCPACRRSLQLEGGLVVGLGVFLRQIVPPSALQPPPALAAAAPLPAAASLAGASGTAAGSGVLGKIGALLGGKAAIAALAAGVTVAGGAGAYEIASRPPVSALKGAVPAVATTAAIPPEALHGKSDAAAGSRGLFPGRGQARGRMGQPAGKGRDVAAAKRRNGDRAAKGQTAADRAQNKERPAKGSAAQNADAGKSTAPGQTGEKPVRQSPQEPPAKPAAPAGDSQSSTKSSK